MQVEQSACVKLPGNVPAGNCRRTREGMLNLPVAGGEGQGAE
jgi:hypothetical protein